MTSDQQPAGEMVAGTSTIDPDAFLPRFGLNQFRPGQKDVIAAVLGGSDCLCIMPTGGGKSLCYQLPSVARDGVTLVVSPLIALMKDQVDTLQQRGISAEFINSSVPSAEQSDRLTQLVAGKYDLFYIAPERFRSPHFIEALRRTKIQLLAIDEAHCISEWGHDFRHDYARLGEHRQRLGNPQTIALTATATVDVRQDVIKQLRLESHQTFVAGFARDNLFYVVDARYSKRDKELALLEHVNRIDGTGIIYASTRKGCEEVHEIIAARTKRKSAVYHAGLQPDDRRKIQDAFMSGKVPIVAATNAFGMGIDKADVRMVLHYNMPGTLEAYYQEAGRAGRDGDPSECILLYSPRDRYIQEFFIDSSYPPREVISQVYEYLRRHPNDPIELTQQELKETLGLQISAEGVGTCERLLEKCGVLERLEPNRNMAAIRVDSDAPALVELLPPQADTRRRLARAIEAIVGSRRYEYVYLHPQELSDRSGLEPSSVQRALRELTRMETFDYVPPFRGRAVHMLRRDLPFQKLEIDYNDIEKRRSASLQKLDRVVQFATTKGCRQTEILRYFGEQVSASCGHCDNCGQNRSTKKVQSSPRVADPLAPDPFAPDSPSTIVADSRQEQLAAMAEVARMVLSGVTRAKGRFGKQLITAMLCGSKSAKVTKWKLDELSTFGILSGFTQIEVNALQQALIEQNLVEQNDVDRFRPTITLTESGRAVMRAERELPMALDISADLLSKVVNKYRQHRHSMEQMAAKAGRPQPNIDTTAVPKTDDPENTQYVEPSDEAIARCELRLDPAEGGFGAPMTSSVAPSASVSPKSNAGGRQGNDLQYSATPDVDRGSSQSHADATGLAPARRPSYYWTWRILQDGYTAEECLTIRRLDFSRLIVDLLRALEAQYPVDPRWVLSAGEITWLEQYMRTEAADDREQLANCRPPRIGPDLVELFLKIRE